MSRWFDADRSHSFPNGKGKGFPKYLRWCFLNLGRGSVAQLEVALGSYPIGRRFDPDRSHSFPAGKGKGFPKYLAQSFLNLGALSTGFRFAAKGQ